MWSKESRIYAKDKEKIKIQRNFHGKFMINIILNKIKLNKPCKNRTEQRGRRKETKKKKVTKTKEMTQ